MRRKDQAKCSSLAEHAPSADVKTSYPNLADFLTAAVYEDGARRESPTVTIWATGGQWKVNVRDRAEELVMWLSAGTLLELLGMLELMVLESEGPWRHDSESHPRNGKRQKT